MYRNVDYSNVEYYRDDNIDLKGVEMLLFKKYLQLGDFFGIDDG
jgi:hypothetical protein